MGVYLVKRVLLILPTLFGIMLINFLIIQFAPGGPAAGPLEKGAGGGRRKGGARPPGPRRSVHPSSPDARQREHQPIV